MVRLAAACAGVLTMRLAITPSAMAIPNRRTFDPRMRLSLVGSPIPDPEPLMEAGRAILDDVDKQYGGEVSLRTELRRGDPAEAVLDAAEEEGADLIVVGNKGMRGARRFLLGSVPDRVSRHAP